LTTCSKFFLEVEQAADTTARQFTWNVKRFKTPTTTS
jgi:hypothetical protein